MQYAAAHGKCGPGSKIPSQEWQSIRVFYPEDREHMGEAGFLEEVKRLVANGIAVVSKDHYDARTLDRGWGAEAFNELFRVPETTEVQVWGTSAIS